MTGILSTQALLAAAGVGDVKATAHSALIQWVTQDGVAMLGKIAFSYQFSQSLDAECKAWRLAADWFNDAGMLLTLVTPHIHVTRWFMPVACTGTLLRALCGVVGGATRGSLTQHFAVA